MENNLTTNSMDKAKEIMKELSESMGRKNYLEMIKANRDIALQQIAIFDNNEVAVKLLEKAKEIGKENIVGMTDDEIRAVFAECEANDLLDSVDKDIIDKGFLRDYLSYIEDTEAQLAELNEMITTYEKELEETNNKVTELVAEVGDVSKFIMKAFMEQSETTTGETQDNFKRGVMAVEDAMTLRPIIQLYKTIGIKGTLREYHDKNERQRIIDKFYKVVKSYKLSTNLRHFTAFETRFMEDKYHVNPNLFIFAIMKYFSNKANGKRTIEGLFITQLSIVLQTIYTDNKSAEDLKEFVGNVSELLDLFL